MDAEEDAADTAAVAAAEVRRLQLIEDYIVENGAEGALYLLQREDYRAAVLALGRKVFAEKAPREAPAAAAAHPAAPVAVPATVPVPAVQPRQRVQWKEPLVEREVPSAAASDAHGEV